VRESKREIDLILRARQEEEAHITFKKTIFEAVRESDVSHSPTHVFLSFLVSLVLVCLPHLRRGSSLVVVVASRASLN
jgi:hypothetical protein